MSAWIVDWMGCKMDEEKKEHIRAADEHNVWDGSGD